MINTRIRTVSPDKTEVSGSSPEWPTKSLVSEELPIRELLIMLLGEERRRKRILPFRLPIRSSP